MRQVIDLPPSTLQKIRMTGHHHDITFLYPRQYQAN